MSHGCFSHVTVVPDQPFLESESEFSRRAKASCKYDAVCYCEGVGPVERRPCRSGFMTCERSGGGALRRLWNMLVVTGLLAGIAGLVLYEAICEGIGCSEKLHDRYHE